MVLEFRFYVPIELKDTDDVKEIEALLDKVKVSSLTIKVNKDIISDSEGEQIKSQFLWHLSVIKRIGIKQTRKTKSLYPQLVVFNEGTAITFYPQTYGSEHISIQEFLEGLTKNQVKCLHDKHKIEEIIINPPHKPVDSH